MPPATLGNRARIKLLEEQLAEMRRTLQEMSGRLALRIGAPPLRLVKTITNASYPTPPADTFEIEFLDGTYTRTAGNQTATFTARGKEDVAHALGNLYYPEGARAWVVEANRKFWIVAGEPIAREIRATLTAALATTDLTVTSTINEYFDGFDPTGVSGASTLRNKPDGVANYQFEAASGAIAYARWDDQDGFYRIFMIDCPSL